MQKLKQKSNEKPVGANCIRPHFEGITLKNQKGITLIALIITVIVMLILVGVTINVALNGGLFTKAETATSQTEEKAILEEMLAMMEIDDNGKINPDEIIVNMKSKYEINDSNKPNITITGKLGTYNYIVSETEIKIGSKEIEPFDWEDVGLIVDTNSDYIFNDPNSGTEYIIIFTEKGELIVKEDGTTTRTYSAKEYIDDGKLIIPFTYAYTGKTYDATLTMNSDGINVDASLPGLGTVTYKKVTPKEYPVAYGIGENIAIIEISKTEVVFIGQTGTPTIVEVDSINKIGGFENTTITNEGNIEYTRVIVITREDDYKLIPAVYCEKNDAWYFVTNNNEIRNDISPMYLDTTTSKEELEQIIQEERDKMNNSSN